MNPNAATIIEDSQCEALLAEIFARHSLLELRFEDGEDAYQTAIIEFVPAQRYFVLDALVPAAGNDRLRGNDNITLRTRIEGIEVIMSATITQRGGEPAAPYYKTAYPHDLSYPQRRGEYRAQVPLARGIGLEFTLPDETRITGELRDLSPSGFSARLHGALPAPLTAAEHTDIRLQGRCVITFADDEAIETIAEICHIVPPDGRAAARIGACFVDLDAPAERRLERHVARLERERARIR